MFKTIIAAGAMTVALSGAASAAVIFSDDFEAETLGTPVASLTKWDITAPTVDVIGNDGTTSSFDFYTGNGMYLDMNGSSAPDTEGRIETKGLLGLVFGKRYTISFDYGTNSNPGPLPALLTFGLGAMSYTLVINAIPATLLNFTYDFVYDGTGDYMHFADTSGTPLEQGGPVVDNVVLSAVPLPAAGLLLLAGLGGLAAIGRRRATALVA